MSSAKTSPLHLRPHWLVKITHKSNQCFTLVYLFLFFYLGLNGWNCTLNFIFWNPINYNKWKGCLIFALIFLALFSYFLFFSQVTGSPALIFRHRDGSDLALYQLAAHSKDANVTFRRLPRPGALTLLWMKRPQGGRRGSAGRTRRPQPPVPPVNVDVWQRH